MSAKIPNTFLVGAPRCGTTALAQYLSEHPAVYFSPLKEPQYFSLDMPGYRQCKNDEEYLALFAGAGEEQKIIAEGSATYLHSHAAAQAIAEFSPQAKILVILRNPLEMLPSLHAQLFYSLDEDVASFEQAWHLQDERAQGRHIPARCRDAKILQYARLACFGEQLLRYVEIFGRERCHVMFYEEFKQNPKKVYEDILAFLEIPSDAREDFPVVNARSGYRNTFVRRFTQHPPQALLRCTQAIARALGVSSLGIGEALERANKAEVSQEKLSDALRNEIIDTLRADTVLLKDVLGRVPWSGGSAGLQAR